MERAGVPNTKVNNSRDRANGTAEGSTPGYLICRIRFYTRCWHGENVRD